VTLAGAFRGELYRTLRNGSPLFWAYCAVPLVMILMALVVELSVGLDVSKARGMRPFADVAVAPLATAGNPIAHLFYAVGAATLFGGEYRWETWRLLAPRNRRSRLVGAKFLVFALLVAASLLAGLAATLAVRLLGAAVDGFSLGWKADGATLLRLAAAFAGSVAEAAILGGVAACVAIATRSVTAAILLPFLLSTSAVFALEYYSPPALLDAMLLIPSHSGDALRSWAGGGPVDSTTALASLAALVFLALLPAAAAVLMFKRQDLARE
jgi:ABC-2 type transport system permease protein